MIDTIAFLITGIGLAASIIYYANILNNANKTRELQIRAQEQATETRQAQLFMNLYNVTINEEMNQKWYDAMYMNIKDYKESRVKLHTLFQKYNGIGHLMMQGFLDVESTYHYSEGYRAVLLWMKWGDHLVSMRKNAFNPDYMDGFQYMAEQMMKYREEKRLPNELLPQFQN